MAFSFQPKVVTDGMIFCFDAANTKSYPGSGTIATDLSLTAITGSLTNGPTFSSTNNGIINFDGTDDYIGFTNTLGNNQSRLTVETWVYVKRNTVTFNSDHIVSKGTTGDYQYSLRLRTPTGGTSGSVSMMAWVADGSADHLAVTSSVAINDGWHHLVGVIIENTSATIYIDGILNNTNTTVFGTWNKNGAAQFRIGGRGDGINYLTGSIAQVKLYNRALSTTEVLQNYNAICGRFGKTPTITDGDALSFVNAANISNETQQSAINTLVTDLKGAGLWSKMKAIYPFVGGTAASHKWNLKDPRDVDAAFRLVFYGGWTHSTNGADPNGTTAYADTFLTPSSTLLQNSTHISFYSRENSTGTEVEMGVSNSTTQANRLFIEINTSGTTYISVNDTFSTTYVSFADTDARGYYIGTRTSSNSKTAFRNNIAKGTSSAVSDGLANWSIYIGAYHSYTGVPIQYYSTKQCAFATIGDGLTDTDAANLYTIVQKYQTTLGRQV